MSGAAAAREARLIEISGPITSGMWDYNVLDLEGVVLPSVAIEPITTIARDKYAIDAVRLTTLSGTYVETAAHMIDGAPLLDAFPIGRFVRPARLMRLPEAGPRTLYTRADLERHAPDLEEGEALLIDTGWGARWNEPGYVKDAPAFDVDTVEWFVAQPFSMLGVDTPVMDCLWKDEPAPAPASGPSDLLGRLYDARRDMLLLAPLVDLGKIAADEGTVIAFPLALGSGVCSAPCRAAFAEGVRLSGA